MTDATAGTTDAVVQRAVRKAAWRLIPLLCAAYILNYIGRTLYFLAASMTLSAALALCVRFRKVKA